jgi:hypothetical protein
MSQDYYSQTKAPCKPCKIQTCDRDAFGPVIIEETMPIWDDHEYAFVLAIRAQQATLARNHGSDRASVRRQACEAMNKERQRLIRLARIGASLPRPTPEQWERSVARYRS